MADFVSLLGAALSIWQHKLAQKYRDRYHKFIRILKDEYSKPETSQDHAVIDNAEFELILLRDSFIAQARGPETPS